MIKKLSVIMAAALALAGCMVGPDYHAPKVQAPGKFLAGTQPASTRPTTLPEPIDLTRWWESFHDPVLNQLIARGVATSLDISLAEARVREARASLEQDIGTLFPTLDASGTYSRSRESKNLGTNTGSLSGIKGVTPANASQLSNALSGLSSGTSNLYQAGFDAGWELDVFGGTRRAIEAARATLEAQIDARRNTTVTLLSEVARNYIILRGVQHERAAVLDNLRAQRDNLDLTLSKFRAGIATDLDVARQEAQVASTESQLPTLDTGIQQSIHRLGVLLGREPEALEVELTPDAPLPDGPPRVPPGLPSDLLRRRPDVQQAERNLAAASANIGVAVSELYPKFSLTGSFGLESNALKSFTRGSSEFWSFGPSVTWRIFDAGQLMANVRIQRARFDQAGIQYRQAILQALQEVEDALVAYEKEQVRRDALQRSVDADIRAVSQAKKLNQAGVVDFLNVLTAQETLFVAQDELAQSEQTVSTNLVALYKSLGGGWDVTDPKPATQPVKVAKRP
jgi:NodT family efflux transporter outer membrane factor (OMF) lipoprotein